MGTEERPTRRYTSTALIASLLSIVVTGLVATAAEDGAQVGYFALAVALFALAAVHVRALIQDLQSARNELDLDEAVKHAVPSLVTFRKREDTLTLIGSEGDARLEWLFELTSPADTYTKTLTFPIFAEGDRPRDEPPPITIERIEVNDEPREVKGALRPVERRVSVEAGRPSLEYALLHVPVDLGRKETFCRVRLQMYFRGVFPNCGEQEAFYVDVPYLTKSLRVSVAADHGAVRMPPDRPNGVEAISGLMEVDDPSESGLQSVHCRHATNALVWEPPHPKLSYRYKVWFRVERPARDP
jgi:hypothetical protein